MAEAKHTRGPWAKSEQLNGPWWQISSGHSVHGEPCKTGRQAVACVHGEGKRGAKAYAEMFEANARLIARAPELLEWMQDVMADQGTRLAIPHIDRAVEILTELAGGWKR